MPSSSWQPAACKEQQTSCRACNNSSTAFDPLCTIWKLCTLKTPCWECTEYAVTSSSHILPFKTFKDCFWLGPTKHPKLLVLLLQQWPRRGQSHLCICSCSSQALEAWQGNVQAIPAMAGLTWLMLATSIAMMKAEMTWTLHELGERKKTCKSVCVILENTISMLAASCQKHLPKLQVHYQHLFYLFLFALFISAGSAGAAFAATVLQWSWSTTTTSTTASSSTNSSSSSSGTSSKQQQQQHQNHQNHHQ